MTKGAKKDSAQDGILIIIGGHEDHDGERVILKEVAAHVRNGRLVLATVASHEPEGYLEKYRTAFADLASPRSKNSISKSEARQPARRSLPACEMWRRSSFPAAINCALRA